MSYKGRDIELVQPDIWKNGSVFIVGRETYTNTQIC